MFQVVWTVPMFFWGLGITENAVTVERILYVAAVASLAGFIPAILGWDTVSLPLIKRREKRGQNKRT